MGVCHGQGEPNADPFFGGCCFNPVGVICSQRWYIDYSTSTPPGDVGTATIYNSARVNLGTVDNYIKTIINGKPRQDIAKEMLQGSTYACGALARDLADNGVPTGANWQRDLNARWSATFDPGGRAQAVGDYWVATSRPRNWCVTYGPGDAQCCFLEGAATNAARVAKLSVTRVTIANRSLVA
jgi:hypothetical protein